tara:strand:- start:366 stop:590 length:225 start_codon:yes stop_codon:yes gene_type:complete
LEFYWSSIGWGLWISQRIILRKTLRGYITTDSGPGPPGGCDPEPPIKAQGVGWGVLGIVLAAIQALLLLDCGEA